MLSRRINPTNTIYYLRLTILCSYNTSTTLFLSTKRRLRNHFIDRVTLTATAGNGGKGCTAFDYVTQLKRKPNGGNGGNGGSVVILADATQKSLPFNKTVQAPNGTQGGGNFKDGKDGKNVILRVPCGVVVKKVRELHLENEMLDDIERNNTNSKTFDDDDDDDFFINEEEQDPLLESSYETIADLDKPASYIVVSKGGRGGKGNGTISTFTKRNDKSLSYATPQNGESYKLQLELKLIADVGFVGFPNAGKSSLLSSLSKATPKIAPYKFTTLHPKLGTMVYRDSLNITCADLPGLIEGAREGRGRGFEFLKHIERTRVLLYVLDICEKPLHVLKTLIEELREYNDGVLLDRRAIVVLNKIDLISNARAGNVMNEVEHFVQDCIDIKSDGVIGISAGVTGEGLVLLSKLIRTTVLEEKGGI